MTNNKEVVRLLVSGSLLLSGCRGIGPKVPNIPSDNNLGLRYYDKTLTPASMWLKSNEIQTPTATLTAEAIHRPTHYSVGGFVYRNANFEVDIRLWVIEGGATIPTEVIRLYGLVDGELQQLDYSPNGEELSYFGKVEGSTVLVTIGKTDGQTAPKCAATIPILTEPTPFEGIPCK